MALERHADAPPLLPHDPAVFLDAAVVQDELSWNVVAAMHFEAGAAGAEINNIARSRGALQINKYGSRPGACSGRPHAMKSSVILHLILFDCENLLVTTLPQQQRHGWYALPAEPAICALF